MHPKKPPIILFPYLSQYYRQISPEHHIYTLRDGKTYLLIIQALTKTPKKLPSINLYISGYCPTSWTGIAALFTRYIASDKTAYKTHYIGRSFSYLNTPDTFGEYLKIISFFELQIKKTFFEDFLKKLYKKYLINTENT